MNNDKEENKQSSAQVAGLVRPQVVSQTAGGLKPGRKRPYRLMARFSESEFEIVQRRATTRNLSINEYIRIQVLGQEYMSAIDPEQRKLLMALHKELSRQGNNLNQIAKRLNIRSATELEADSMLLIIGRSLLSAHMSVRQALAEGQTAP